MQQGRAGLILKRNEISFWNYGADHSFNLEGARDSPALNHVFLQVSYADAARSDPLRRNSRISAKNRDAERAYDRQQCALEASDVIDFRCAREGLLHGHAAELRGRSEERT